MHAVAVNGIPRCLCDILHRRDFETARRQAVAGRLVAVGADLIEQRRVDEAGHQRANLDPVFGELDLQPLGQPAHRELRRRIDGKPGDAIEARRRSGVEDRRSGGRAQQRHRHVDAVDDAAEIDRNQPVRLFGRHVEELAARSDTGVVEQDVEATAARGCEFGKGSFPLVAVAYVHDVARRGAVGKQRGGFVDALLVDVGDPDEPALCCEILRGGAADARSAAGDEYRLPCHPVLPDMFVSREQAKLTRPSSAIAAPGANGL